MKHIPNDGSFTGYNVEQEMKRLHKMEKRHELYCMLFCLACCFMMGALFAF